jgi:DNA-binding NarL/FixJ family response regulator
VITIALSEDHSVVRHALRSLLCAQAGLRVVGEAADGLDAIQLVDRLRPHVLVADLVMPVLGGLDVTREVRRRFPSTRIVILSMYGDYAYVQEALAAGASAYVLKDASGSDLVRAIHAAHQGRRLLCPPLSEEGLDAYVRRAAPSALDPYQTLTVRERQVLQLAADGYANHEIASRLDIGVRTVESHRANLMRKLALRNRGDLIRYAITRGLVSVASG